MDASYDFKVLENQLLQNNKNIQSDIFIMTAVKNMSNTNKDNSLKKLSSKLLGNETKLTY